MGGYGFGWMWVWDDAQISNIQKELKYLDSFKFHYISTDLGGIPLVCGVGGCGCECMWVCERVPYTCRHMHTHACMHARVSNDIIGWISLWGQHLHEIIMFNMYMCVCVHVCEHACM